MIRTVILRNGRVCTPNVSPVNNDGVRGGVIFVSAGSVFQAAAADELMGQQHSTEVGVLACTLIKDQL